MNLQRFTTGELAVQRASGRVLQTVPRGEVEVTQLIVRDGSTSIQYAIGWPNGPRGHALVGICPDGCCFVAELPASWRSRGRDIAGAIPWPHPDLIRKFASENRT